ncbi:hypothetical protein PBY51_001694 [Eleginops maclovinus]|uniref:LRRNT domain-containing protein n=1 Tax=Eleginops maclovinus TaxID=56733 RepID=A0AAN8AD22_ELEMC|nr:hypothetical protein PBY51_001694 [Eleginops maclovinus]
MWIFHRADNSQFFFSIWNQCLYYAAVACLLFPTVRTDDVCPESCICARDAGTVTCRDWEDTEVPVDIPEWTSTLILKGRNISTLQRGAFMSNGTETELTTLSLSYNGIRVIEPYAFLGLPRLHLLDLSHNSLEFISARAFHGLLELRSLYLNHSILPPATEQLSNALSTQSLANLHRLELAGNMLKYIPQIRLDMHNLHVASHVQRAGVQRGIPVEKLRAEDVDCMNENLEAVSYVFLGLVLALIGVVFLMVLYLNRGGIKRWLNNIREACRDQMEVYHYRYEQDSDPRLANVAV